MRTVRLVLVGVVLSGAIIVGAGLIYLRSTGLSAHAEAGQIETAVAKGARRFAIPSDVRARRSPIAPSPDALVDGMGHYADHCAVCHANDGSGNTEMGKGLFPKAPDMRLPATQDLSDGELFYIIEHGIRFTGMPGWTTGTQAGEESAWRLVLFAEASAAADV